MEESKVPKPRDIITLINEAPPMQITALDFVKEKYIANYNACNPDKMGELHYHRQLIHFNQALANSAKLLACDKFSLYACFATCAANGYDLDPAANNVYLIPKSGKAYLWRQAGAHVARLMRTNQISFADQVQFVYRGDDFMFGGGKVMRHIETGISEEMVQAYVRFVLPDGMERFFRYRKSDWEGWRSKSDVADGDNWNFKNSGQPEPGFLRTKVIKHACTEKVWAIGTLPIVVEQFQDVQIETDATLQSFENEEGDPGARIPRGNNDSRPAASLSAPETRRTPDPIPSTSPAAGSKKPDNDEEW